MKKIDLKLFFLITLAFCIATRTFAVGKGHAAHEHGIGKLNIAIEGVKIRLELELPGDTAYGFEHPAQSDEDKKAIEKAKTNLSQASKLFQTDSKFKCVFSVSKIDPSVEDEDHDGHRELHATYAAVCSTTPVEGILKFHFDTALPRLHELRIQLIGDTTQTSVELVRGAGQIKL
jgi:hypothetical protein